MVSNALEKSANVAMVNSTFFRDVRLQYLQESVVFFSDFLLNYVALYHPVLCHCAVECFFISFIDNNLAKKQHLVSFFFCVVE